MPLITWNQNLSLGVPEVDSQHQQLVNMVNQLHEAMAQGQGKTVLAPVLTGLLHYTRTHFGAEEQLMQRAGYPQLEEHKKQHEEFVRKVADMKNRFEAGETRLTVEMMNFLQNWLVGHIKGTDRKYVPCVLASLGASAPR